MSNDSPPSYNQLNYNDNLARFFNSQPKTLTAKEVEAGTLGTPFDPALEENMRKSSNDVASESRTKSRSTPFDGEHSNTNSESKESSSRSRPAKKKDSSQERRTREEVAEGTGLKQRTEKPEGSNLANVESGSGGKRHEEESGDSGERSFGKRPFFLLNIT